MKVLRDPIETRDRYGRYPKEIAEGEIRVQSPSNPDNWIEQSWLATLLASSPSTRVFGIEVELTWTKQSRQTEIEPEFQRLARQWYRETAKFSLIQKKAMHPAYQRIIGMGPDALPWIFRELETSRGHWLWALTAITGKDVAKPEQTFDEAVDEWLKWGHEQGYL
jgi:hypothetical protein